MRSHSRIRRVAKWTGIVVCLALSIAWTTSLFVGVTYWPSRQVAVSSTYGGLAILKRQKPPKQHDLVAADFHGLIPMARWLPYWGATEASARLLAFSAFIPYWPFLFAADVPTAYLFWRDRPQPSDCCRNCGYDLTGNVSGRCPECGQRCERIGAGNGPPGWGGPSVSVV